MSFRVKLIGLIAASLLLSTMLYAQPEFKVKGQEFQVHGFFSQGWAYVDQNRYLSFKNQGDWKLTDGGLNVATDVTDKFRVGAQIYDRNIGKTGRGTVTLDWALASYRFKDWFRVRGGKVKTVLGLYNDTQDMQFLSTFAFLPQSMYPNDQRGHTIAHWGGDIYGTVRLNKKYGSFDYTAYGGQKPSDTKGGDYMAMEAGGYHLDDVSGPMTGADLRWNTPLNGLIVGSSFMRQDISWRGRTPAGGPLRVDPGKDHTYAQYASYSFRNLQIDTEYRREILVRLANIPITKRFDSRMWYSSATYRVNKWVALGTYHSRFYSDWHKLRSANDNHIFDQTFSARFDVNKYWNWKVEQHLIDGYGAPATWHGFYPQMTYLTTGQTLKPKTKMFVIRTGVNF